MSASLHQIMIIGNLGRDPEMRYTGSGKPVTNISVATTRKYRNGGDELVEETAWFRVSIWGKSAELANQMLKKGSKVCVLGRMIPSKETGGGPRVFQKQDGSYSASFEVNASEVHFLTTRGDGGEDSISLGQSDEASEDIPF